VSITGHKKLKKINFKKRIRIIEELLKVAGYQLTHAYN